MDEIKRIQKRLNKNATPVKEKKIIKFFNCLLIVLLVGLGALIYCKQDENGTLLKKWFNVDVSFKEMNQTIENTLNNVFSFNKNQEDNVQSVTSLDLYHSLGSNNYSTDDKTIRMLTDGEVVVSSYQDEYKYFVAIHYDNGVNALYTLIDEIKVENGKLSKNDVIGTYQGEYFSCVFKKGEQIISYNEAIK